jgi:hypothetical protein
MPEKRRQTRQRRRRNRSNTQQQVLTGGAELEGATGGIKELDSFDLTTHSKTQSQGSRGTWSRASSQKSPMIEDTNEAAKGEDAGALKTKRNSERKKSTTATTLSS